MLLAFDTATPAVTVALHDGERVVASQTVVDARRQGELLAPAITAVLDDAWVPRQVGDGPGGQADRRAAQEVTVSRRER